MLDGNTIPLLVGVGIALVLVLMGYLLGQRMARRNHKTQEAITQNERERMLQLLNELGAWTTEYSGNVSEYQLKLGQLSEEVRHSASAAQAENRVFVLLQQIMESNEKLKKRLDAAEKQLEKQTLQIQSYLTEARTDGLTGLFNRRAFDQRLEEIFIAYRNGGRSFVIVLIDIDRFKSINDTYGHQAGDEVLQQLAGFLRTQLDRAIMVARFGGEEFAAIMDGPLRFAADRLNEVRKALEHELIETEVKQLQITISVGAAEPREDLVVGPIVRRADEALYAAKNMGRNRVYYHDGRAPTLVGAPELARNES